MPFQFVHDNEVPKPRFLNDEEVDTARVGVLDASILCPEYRQVFLDNPEHRLYCHLAPYIDCFTILCLESMCYCV